MNRIAAATFAVLFAAGAVIAAEPAKPATPATPAKPATPAVKAPEAKAEAKSIIETAKSTGKHNTLVAAIEAAGLADALSGKGPFTVFAPTDEAFAKLPKGTLEELLKPENKAKLADILKFHVIGDKVMAEQVLKMKESSKTLQGSTFKIEVKEGKVHIGTDPKAMALVTATDVKCSNGVIHVIDSVILPAAKAEKHEKHEKDHGGKPSTPSAPKKPN
ncbi:MAG: fasciclin domain-containing protein [Phycisphaerales bacterium]|nr:fasciclin domain-containing protein [Phycisphaerales bacterium]